jgi:hypothetical protein
MREFFEARHSVTMTIVLSKTSVLEQRIGSFNFKKCSKPSRVIEKWKTVRQVIAHAHSNCFLTDQAHSE